MATSSVTVSASDLDTQTEAQRSDVEMQARLPGQPVFGCDDAPVGSSEAEYDMRGFLELLKSNPEAARHQDKHGQLPLHRHIDKQNLDHGEQIDVAVISELLKAYPEAARHQDKHGHLPLHKYIDKHNLDIGEQIDVAVISELLKAYPDSVFIVDCMTGAKANATLNACLHCLSQTDGLPSIIIKSCMHPLHACIRLSAELMAFSRSQRSKDIRLANSADDKAAELEQLACAIARGIGVDQNMHDCLQLAAHLKLKFFISEPECSRRIENLWIMWRRHRVRNERSNQFGILAWIILWISGLNFIFNYIRYLPPPRVRFLMNRASYFVFLVCLLQLPVQAAPGHTADNIGREVFLAYWLLDICVSEAAEFLDIMNKHRLTAFKAVAKYAEDPWNMYDVVALSTAVAAAAVRGCVHAGVGDATAAFSNQLYAWALALLWGRLVNVLSVVSLLGPLLIMALAMVFGDLSKFAFLVVLMELPFVAALYFLESGDGGNESFATFSDSALSFVKIVIGQGPDISSVATSSSVLLSIGSVLLSVLLLNLLIAMFSKTFDTIVENSTQEYLLQKAQLTFTWAHAPRMPPPFTCALALRDWAMNMVARHMWQWRRHNETFGFRFAGWDYSRAEDKFVERVEPPPPTFGRKQYYECIFPSCLGERELEKNPAKREEWTSQWMQECDAKYLAWCEQVLADFEENAEFNSEAQMDKFKSRMLRGMETTVESGKEVKAIHKQVKDLSEAVQQMQASMQLILQKLNP